MAISPTNIRIPFTNYDIITYFLNLASCSEHFISIKHRILATFNINKKNQSERLYAFKHRWIIISSSLRNYGIASSSHISWYLTSFLFNIDSPYRYCQKSLLKFSTSTRIQHGKMPDNQWEETRSDPHFDLRLLVNSCQLIYIQQDMIIVNRIRSLLTCKAYSITY
jgi:hypothetical protein